MVQLTGKKAILFLGDFCLFLVALYIALSLRLLVPVSPQYFLSHVPSFAVIAIFFVVALYVLGMYDAAAIRSVSKKFSYTLYAALFSGVAGVTLFYAFPGGLAPKLVLFFQVTALIPLVFCFRVLFDRYASTQNKTRALLIGEGKEYQELKNAINEGKHYPLRFMEHVSFHGDRTLGEEEIKIFHSLIKKHEIEVIVADIRDRHISGLLPYLYNAASEGVLLYDMKRMYQDVFRRMPLQDINYFWFFENVSSDMKIYEASKRAIDFSIGLVLCIPWAILHPIVSFFIYREDKGPIFIKQERLGRHGKVIYLYKYRTMRFSDNGKWLPESENTVTKIGAVLRKTRIDELPQALALLKGDVSFIGPRPDIIDLGRKLSREVPHYMIRYAVRPGLSGWAVINQEKPPQSLEETILRLQYDLYYVKQRSLFLDFQIILQTIRILLSRTGM